MIQKDHETEIEARHRELWWEREKLISAMHNHVDSETNPVVVLKIKRQYKAEINSLTNEIRKLEEQYNNRHRNYDY